MSNMSSKDFQKSLEVLQRMSKGTTLGVEPLKGPLRIDSSISMRERSSEFRKVHRGGNPLALWERACEIFTEKFIVKGTDYGLPFYATMLSSTFHEMSFCLRQQGYSSLPDNQPNPGGMGSVEYRLPCDTSLRLMGRDRIQPVPGCPPLPDNAACISDPTGRGLLCVFDFGFTISDVCVHTEADNIRSYLHAKGLGRENFNQELSGLFGERAKKADWNF